MAARSAAVCGGYLFVAAGLTDSQRGQAKVFQALKVSRQILAFYLFCNAYMVWASEEDRLAHIKNIPGGQFMIVMVIALYVIPALSIYAGYEAGYFARIVVWHLVVVSALVDFNTKYWRRSSSHVAFWVQIQHAARNLAVIGSLLLLGRKRYWWGLNCGRNVARKGYRSSCCGILWHHCEHKSKVFEHSEWIKLSELQDRVLEKWIQKLCLTTHQGNRNKIQCLWTFPCCILFIFHMFKSFLNSVGWDPFAQVMGNTPYSNTQELSPAWIFEWWSAICQVNSTKCRSWRGDSQGLANRWGLTNLLVAL